MTTIEKFTPYNGLALVWSVDPEALPDFWSHYEGRIAPVLDSLCQKNEIKALLPFQHNPVHFSDTAEGMKWSVLVIILFDQSADHIVLGHKIIQNLGDSSEQFPLAVADRVISQRNFDMYYPKYGGLKKEKHLIQWIEYVVSDPATRAEYYNTQYTFSGPAMYNLYSQSRAGRFIGFEIKERLHNAAALPLWDVIHVSGFTPIQVIRYLLHSKKAWNAQAKQIFGDDVNAKDVMSGWEQQRKKLMIRAKQIKNITIQSQDLLKT